MQDTPAGPSQVLTAARFQIPERRRSHVRRAHVARMLADAEHADVVVVSAHAGMGKTSAVSAWARAQPRVGWVSFERDDETFWAHVLTCLSGLGLAVPQDWGVVGRDQLGVQRVLELAGLLAASPGRTTLVLDGLELVARGLGDELDLLLRRSEGRLRLVLVGRSDPVFPSYRYAARDLLVEIRAADLGLSDEEASVVLRAAGAVVDDDTAHALNRRLGRWPVGLHLVARALAGRNGHAAVDYLDLATEPGVGIEEFLVGEVLDGLRPEVRAAVLDTCVPDVLCRELAEDLAGPAALHLFSRLSELSSLVEPETGQPGWFRYPALLRDLLRARLAYEDPDRLVSLNRRTAVWLRRAGMVTESLVHLARAGAWDDVVDEIVGGLLIGRVLLEGPHGPVSVVAREVPQMRDDPAACVVRAAVALSDREPHRCCQELERARSARSAEGGGDQVRLSMALVEASLASRAGDASLAGELSAAAERGLSEGLADGSPTRAADLYSIAVVSKSYVALRAGDLTTAVEGLRLATDHPAPGSGAWFRSDCLAHLALAETLRGRMSHAAAQAQKALECAESGGVSRGESPVVGAQVALALVALERQDVDRARAMLEPARSRGAVVGDAAVRALFVVADAEVERLDGRHEVSKRRLSEAADALAWRDPWLADHLRLVSARGCLAIGDRSGAASLLASLDDPQRPELHVLTRALRVEQGAEPSTHDVGKPGTRESLPHAYQVTAWLLDGYTMARRKSPGRSRSAVHAALRIAEREHLMSPFRDAGPLLKRWADREPYLRRRLDAMSHRETRETTEATEGREGEPRAGRLAVEPLTPKELEVLAHLAELLTTDEIAGKMFVSVNTVRTHIRSVLRKLGVGRRNAAVRRARELGILGSQHFSS